MSTYDLMVMFGPLLVFVTLMCMAFGVYHYTSNMVKTLKDRND